MMAAGDFLVFQEFLADISNLHDLDADVIKMALVSNTPTIGMTATLAAQTEIAGTGGYTTGGEDISATYSEAAGTATLDMPAAITWTKNGSSPQDAEYAVLHSVEAVRAIGFIHLGGAIDMQAGDLTVDVHANGWFRLTIP